MNEPEFVRISIQSLVDLTLDTERAVQSETRTRSGATWTASNLGYCLRRQYFERVLKLPTTRPIDARTLRVFRVGDLTSDWLNEAFGVAGILIEREASLRDEEWDIACFVDAVIGGPIQPDNGDPVASRVRQALRAIYGDVLPVIGVEIKSVNSKSFWWAQKQNRPVAQEHQLIQTAAYSLVAERQGYEPAVDRWEVFSVSKDDLTVSESSPTRKHKDEVVRRLEELNEAKRTGNIPACSCEGWMVKYCNYAAADGESCCSMHLTESVA